MPPIPGYSVFFSFSLKPPAPQASAGTVEDRVILDSTSRNVKRRLSGSNATTPLTSLRKFFRWSDNGKLSENETSKWRAKPKWNKLTEVVAADSK